MSEKLCNACYKRKYPEFAKRLVDRHIMYNKQMEDLKKLQQDGIANVIQAKEEVKVKKMEKDPEKLEKLYQLGRKDALEWVKNYC